MVDFMGNEELEVLNEMNKNIRDMNAKTDKVILLLKKLLEKTEGM
jgi:hypothetical protein